MNPYSKIAVNRAQRKDTLYANIIRRVVYLDNTPCDMPRVCEGSNKQG
jgi:hypothetical protein